MLQNSSKLRDCSSKSNNALIQSVHKKESALHGVSRAHINSVGAKKGTYVYSVKKAPLSNTCIKWCSKYPTNSIKWFQCNNTKGRLASTLTRISLFIKAVLRGCLGVFSEGRRAKTLLPVLYNQSGSLQFPAIDQACNVSLIVSNNKNNVGRKQTSALNYFSADNYYSEQKCCYALNKGSKNRALNFK